MQKYFLILLLFLFCLPISAQITVLKTAVPIDEVERYDSTTNFVKNPNLYLGQKFFLVPKPQRLRGTGYQGIDRVQNGVVNRSSRGTPHDEVQSKMFVVTNVKEGEASFIHYLTLVDEDSSDTLSFKFDSTYEHNFPFLVDGHLKKLRTMYVGRNYVSRRPGLVNFENESRIIDTKGAVIENEIGDVWEVLDFVLDDEYYDLKILLKNPSGQEYASYTSDILLAHHIFFVPVEKCDDLKKKYGNELFATALKGSVRIGMTRELCEFAWGKPDRVNTTTGSTNREQWVYDGSYLYFQNGKLTTIQD